MNESSNSPGPLAQLERDLEEREAVLQRALARERRRDETGVYARWERLALRRAQSMDRQALEHHAAAFARFVRWTRSSEQIRGLLRDVDNAANKLGEGADGLQAELDARRVRKIEELQARPAIYGAQGRDARWASKRDKTVEYVVRRWCERKWPSKAEFARKVVADTIRVAESNEFFLKETNAERTIIRWITDYLSATHPP